jgi:hypothetical protein
MLRFGIAGVGYSWMVASDGIDAVIGGVIVRRRERVGLGNKF